MANEANPLDKFLRDAENAASFPVNDDHWSRMETRLDEEAASKKRRRLLAWWKLAAVVLLGLGVATLAWQSRQPDASQPAASSATPVVSPTNESLANPEKAAQPSANTASVSSSSTPTITATTTEKDANQPANTHATTHRSTLSNKLSNERSTEKSIVEPKELKPSRATKHQSPTTIQNKEQVVENSVRTSATSTQQPVGKPSIQQAPTANTQWVNGKPMQAIDTQIQWRRPTMSDEEMIRYNPRYQAVLQQYQFEKLDSVTVIRYKPMTPIVPQPAPLVVDSAFATYRLQLLLGTMLWRGFVGGPTWRPAPYVGIGIEKKLTSRLTMAAQVGFTYFSGLQTQNRSVSYRYKFGLDSTVYSAMHRMVFRIQWPVQFRYTINKQHALMAGAGAAWQPDGLSTVTAPAQVLNGGTAPSYNTPMVTKNSLGYLKGIRSWDVFFQAGYQWQWHERMALQLLWQAGLRDMTDNKILSSNRIQRNNGLMIGLRYSFVRSNR